MKRILLISALLYVVCFTALAQRKGKIALEFLPGYSYAFNMPLVVFQDGNKVADFVAQYETRSFESPVYYSYRLGYETETSGWELEMNHLKIYLQNTNDVVERFSVSHGYNQVWLNHLWKKPYGVIRAGLGTVVSHDENTVNGLRLDETGGLFNDGYYFSGVSVHGSYQYRHWFGDYIFLSAEAKLSAAYGWISVVNGHARTPIIAYGLLVGAGVAF